MTEQSQEMRYQGLGVSEGVVIGQVVRLHDGAQPVYRRRISKAGVEAERQRFREALKLASRQLTSIKEFAEERLGRDHAYIFDAHLLMLEDEKLTADIEHQITDEQANAEWAVKVAGDRLLSLYPEIEDEYLRARGSDVEDVMQRLLTALSGVEDETHDLSDDAVIVAMPAIAVSVGVAGGGQGCRTKRGSGGEGEQ